MSAQPPEFRKKSGCHAGAGWSVRSWQIAVALLAVSTVGLRQASAQRPRFTDPYEIQNGATTIPPPATLQGSVTPGFNPQGVVVGPGGFAAPVQQGYPQTIPAFQAAPAPITSFPPPSSIQPQSGGIPAPGFDPFATNTTPWPIVPGNAGGQSPVFLPSNSGPQPGIPFGTDYSTSGLIQNYAQSGSGSGSPTAWPGEFWNRLRNDTMPRFLQRPRWRQTWIAGDGADEVDMLETEITTTATFPGSKSNLSVLRISPGFIFHFLDGPGTVETGFDLPAQVYSSYVAFDLFTDPRKPAGIEVNLTLGVYTDFENVSSDSLRVTGTGVGFARVNPYTVFKFGAEYYDRVRLKMLPAFGFFMQPTNEMKLDLYFPRPRFSHKLPSLANYEIWGYVGAEYGGGSWTIERSGGLEDQVDINDVRAFTGFEWAGPRRVTGFIEGGYVIEREMLYRTDPTNRLQLGDTFMIRTGIAF